MFDFNYDIKCWIIRKYNVEKFIEDNKILEKINELTIENTVPRKIDKDGNVLEWYVRGDEELRQLQFLVQKLYNYVLYAYDKDVLKKKDMTKEQKKALEDNENGIKSYIRDEKRGKKTYYKKPKWAIIDDEKIKKNKQKQENFNKNTGKIIDEQVKNYEKFKEEVKNMDKKQLEIMKINKQDMMSDICYDLKVCTNAKESVNRVYISEGMRSRHDILSDCDIEYNKKNIKIILNNWSSVVSLSKNKPFSYIHTIYMDFDIAIRKIKLTQNQKEILYKILNGESMTSKDTMTFDRISDKIYKILNKN